MAWSAAGAPGTTCIVPRQGRALNAVTVSEHGPTASGWKGSARLPASSVSAERYSWPGIQAVTRAPASGLPPAATATVMPPSPAAMVAGAVTDSSRGRAV